MSDQKTEILLNLALSVPEWERERTEDLDTGYDKQTDSWELIVKYQGPIREKLKEIGKDIKIRELLCGFAVIRAGEEQISLIAGLPGIEYIEKPKRLFFAMKEAKAASCFFPASGLFPEGELDGTGVVIAVIDSGIDCYHEAFRDSEGRTRISFLYDQENDMVMTKDEIDRALRGEEDAGNLPVDDSGHGTAVCGIAAGSRTDRSEGCASNAEILVVKLGGRGRDPHVQTAALMEGIDFAVRKILETGKPGVINLSFGNTYGPHDGTSLLERYLDAVSMMGKLVFVTGTGNEGDSGGHTVGILGERMEEVLLSVSEYEMTLNLQIWKSYADEFDLYLVDPSGKQEEKINGEPGYHRKRLNGNGILVYCGEPSPFRMAQEIYLEWIPEKRFVTPGIWRIRMVPGKILCGKVDFWLPSSSLLGEGTRFLRPVPETTLTIPSTGKRVISVGAYDASSGIYAPFSGRGDTTHPERQKPDLAAPGVELPAPVPGGGYGIVTGTSFAAPMVSGAAAILMQWGIVMGNDPYLYGDKLKAYLRKGARRKQNLTYPDEETGYGFLCLQKSFPD